ncbi:MAG: tetratricopeptide repeat protein [Candidatus Hermodarchaeota archaeon]
MINREEAQNYYNKANVYISEKKYINALSCLKKALELYPNYAQALSLLGYVHYQLKFKELSKEEVFELSKKALSIDDKSPLTWFHMGNANSYVKKFDNAIVCYLKAHELGLKNEKLWNNLGSTYLKKGEFEKAIFYYIKAIMLNPYFAPVLNNIGHFYFKKKNYQLAIYFFDKSIKLDPIYSAPWNNKGIVYEELQDFDNALKCYLEGHNIDPDDAKILNNIGINYLFRKDYEKAIDVLEEAINKNPLYGNPWVNLGAIYSDKKDYEKAIKCYEEAIKIDSSLFKAWYNKGNIHFRRNEIDDSKLSYEKALNLNPLFAPAWTNLGNIYLLNNEFIEAEKCFKKAIEIHSIPIIEWFNLGNVYRLQGDFIKAIKSYQNVLNLNLNYGGAWFNQGVSYLMINELDMAIFCFEEAININPNNNRIYGNLGIAYEGKGEYDKSIECFHKVSELNPNDSLALSNIGRLYFYKGDINKAIKYFRKALQLPPSHIVYFKQHEFAYYTTDIDELISDYGEFKEVISYQSDIWVYLGIAYNQLGNFAEVKNCFNKAIELNPKSIIALTNLGIICLEDFEYEEALKNFDLAIDIAKKMDLKKELNDIVKFKKITQKTAELKPKLDIIDNKIKDLVKIQNVQQLIECVAYVNNLLKEITTNVDFRELYSITIDLLFSKYHIFECLFNCVNFNRIDFNKINKAKELFASKTKFIKFFYSLQNIIDIINFFKGYSNIEEIPKEIEEQIIVSINTIDSLGFELSKLITGSIKTEQKIFKFPSREIQKIIRPGIENSQISKEVLEPEYRSEFETKEKKQIHYIDTVCKELEEEIPCYKNKKLKKSDFLEFIYQFPEELRSCMAKILKKIIYITWKEMSTNLIKLINDIVEEIEYAYIILFRGARYKSQDPWVYFTKKFSGEILNCIEINKLPELLSSLEDNRDYYFIFLDDVILTGTQFVDFFEDEMIDIIDDLEFISNSNNYIHFYLIAGVGSFDSKKYISKNLKIFTEDRIRYGITTREKDKAFLERNCNDLDLRRKLMIYLKEKDPDWWNGFKDSQSLIVLEWNTPDNTIGCLWNSTEDLNALFPRI